MRLYLCGSILRNNRNFCEEVIKINGFELQYCPYFMIKNEDFVFQMNLLSLTLISSILLR